MGKHACSSSSICVVLLATVLTSVGFTNAKEVVRGRVSTNALVVPPSNVNDINEGATSGGSRGGRPASLPATVEVNVTLGDEDVHMQLTKQPAFTSNDLPVYVLSTDSQGQKQSHRAELPETEYAVYRDPKHEAAFGLYVEKDGNGTQRVKMEGIVHSGGKIYDLRSTGHTRRKVVRRRREVADQHNSDPSHTTYVKGSTTASINGESTRASAAAEGNNNNNNSSDGQGGGKMSAEEKNDDDGEVEEDEEDFEVDVISDPSVDVSDSLPKPPIIQRKKEMTTTVTLNASHPFTVSRTPSPLQPLPVLPGPPHRRRRQGTKTSVYVDVVALVDYGVYKTWYDRSTATTSAQKQQDTLVKLRRYYAFIMNGVSMMYDTVDSTTYKINVRLSSVVISTSVGGSDWTERFRRTAPQWDEVDASSVLNAVSEWATGTDLLPSYDHLMVFSGYDLSKTENGVTSDKTTGLAYTGTVCATNGKATSLVEDLGGFQCIGTAAHELGHGMLAEHDGTGNACRSEDRYVMAAGTFTVTSANKYNPWVFSSCSITYFNDFFNERLRTARGRQCLYNTLTTSSSVTNVTSLTEGQLYNPDEQCRQVYGPSSRLCRGPEFGTAEDVCTDMFCYDPTTSGTCYQLVAARGTTCGNNKWCESGRCVENSAAPAATDGCVFGDQPGAAFQGKTCQAFVDAIPGYCYQDVVKVRCCATCGKHYRPVYNCEYGDKSTGCSSSSCSWASISYKEDCCGTCNHGDPITTTPAGATTKTTTTTTPTTTTTTTPPTTRAATSSTTPVPRVTATTTTTTTTTATTANSESVKTSPAGTTNPRMSTAPPTTTIIITTTPTPTTSTTTPTTTSTTSTTTPTRTTTTTTPTTTTTSTTSTTTPTTTTSTTSTTTPPTTTSTTFTTTPTATTNPSTTTTASMSTFPTATLTGTGTDTPTPIPTIAISTNTLSATATTSHTTYSEDTTASPETTPTRAVACVDNSSVTINQKDCRTLVGSSLASCYNPLVISHCCKSCQDASTGIKDCEYGDRSPQDCKGTNTTDVCARLGQTCCSSCYTGGQDPSVVMTPGVLMFSVGVALLSTLSISF